MAWNRHPRLEGPRGDLPLGLSVSLLKMILASYKVFTEPSWFAVESVKL
jgi:hypothetical protein